jgi:hypothetical protein
MIWTALVFDFLTIWSYLSTARCLAVSSNEQPGTLLDERLTHCVCVGFGSTEAHSESDEFYSRYPTAADGGLGLHGLDFSFLEIDKS